MKKWWLNSQGAWGKWSETNERLIESEKKLSEANERLIDKKRQIQSLHNSRSYRLGRALTWPIRKLLYKKR